VEGAEEMVGVAEVEAWSGGLLQRVAHCSVAWVAAAVDHPP
jgi:hypothetical protein